MVDFNVGVVLPAAGSGERMSTTSSLPKQYIKILDKPLFLYATEAFLSFEYVKKIVLVADVVDRMLEYLTEYGLANNHKLIVIPGDTTRHRSIKKGLQELEKFKEACEIKVVLVHDAVRPFVPRKLVCELVMESVTCGAAGPVKPLVSTVLKCSGNSTMEESLQRNLYVNSETPQSFLFETLLSAYSKVTDQELEFGTECLQLVFKYGGIRAKLIRTEEDLSKVTYARDVRTIEAVLREKAVDVCIISEEETEVLKGLVHNLRERVSTLKTILGSPSQIVKDNGKTYNSIVLLHDKEIHQDLHLLDFANLIDLERSGVIVHIIDQASIDGLQTMPVYNLHKNSRKMTRNYEKLNKGVVVIHCVSSIEINKIISIVSTLVLGDPQTFSGQTLFL